MYWLADLSISNVVKKEMVKRLELTNEIEEGGDWNIDDWEEEVEEDDEERESESQFKDEDNEKKLVIEY